VTQPEQALIVLVRLRVEPSVRVRVRGR